MWTLRHADWNLKVVREATTGEARRNLEVANLTDGVLIAGLLSAADASDLGTWESVPA